MFVQSYETIQRAMMAEKKYACAQRKRTVDADANDESHTPEDKAKVFALGRVTVVCTQTGQTCKYLVRTPFTKTRLTPQTNPFSIKQLANGLRRFISVTQKLTHHAAVIGSPFSGALPKKKKKKILQQLKDVTVCIHVHFPGGRTVLGLAFSTLRSFTLTTGRKRLCNVIC